MGASRPRRPWRHRRGGVDGYRGAGAAGVVYLGAEAVGGHLGAGGGNRWVSGLVQTAHLVSGGLWVGALVALVAAGTAVPPTARAAGWRAAVRRLGPVAGWSALAVIVTGTLAARREVEHLYFLRHSAYGRYLLVKLALVAAMLGLAATMRMAGRMTGVSVGVAGAVGDAGGVLPAVRPPAGDVLPAVRPPAGGVVGAAGAVVPAVGGPAGVAGVPEVDPGPAPGERDRWRSTTGAGSSPAGRVRRGGLPGLVRVEAGVGLAVLLVAAALAGVAPGRGHPLPAQEGSVLAGPAFANAVVGGGLVRVALAPATPGRNRLTVLTPGPAPRGSLVPPPQGGPAPGERSRTPPGPEGRVVPPPPDGAAPDEPSMTPPPAPEGRVVSPPPDGPAPGELSRHLPAEASAGTITATLSCTCSAAEVTADLVAGDGAWHADLDLPAAGVWRATLRVDGRPAVAPVALRVDDGGAPGAPPVVVAAPADLSAHDARRCRSFQLGMVLALGFLNADGGVDGRKVVVASADDGGDSRRAGALGQRFRAGGAHVAAPCGAGSAGAVRSLAPDVPVVVADPQTALVEGERIFRLAPDPYAEGWALARILARNTFTLGGATGTAGTARPDVARAVAVVADEGDPSSDRMLDGLRDGLDVPGGRPDRFWSDSGGIIPPESLQNPGAGSDTADVTVTVFTRGAADDLAALVRQATDSRRFAAAFLRSDPADLAGALDQIEGGDLIRSSAVVVPARHFDETFYRASKIGRRGDVLVLGELAPDSADSLVYTRMAASIFPGERPSIDGLRGYLAGQAIAAGLRAGTSPTAISRRLAGLGPFSPGVASGWSPAAPAAGAWRLFLYKGSFSPAGLMPGARPEPGRFFDEGAWSRAVTGNTGLCGPQERFTPGPCRPPDR